MVGLGQGAIAADLRWLEEQSVTLIESNLQCGGSNRKMKITTLCVAVKHYCWELFV